MSIEDITRENTLVPDDGPVFDSQDRQISTVREQLMEDRGRLDEFKAALHRGITKCTDDRVRQWCSLFIKETDHITKVLSDGAGIFNYRLGRHLLVALHNDMTTALTDQEIKNCSCGRLITTRSQECDFFNRMAILMKEWKRDPENYVVRFRIDPGCEF